jgi:hypothetical protein
MACRDVEKANKVRGRYSATSQKNVSVNIVVRFEVFTAVMMKNAVFWGVAPIET